MQEQQGIYEIINNEGMICFVDTATPGKKTFGKDWVDICRSALEGLVLKGEILNYQYRTHQGEPINDKPTGFVVKINGNIEVFLPFKLCGKFRESDAIYDGEIVAVMVESFDPNSLSIIVREITITDKDIDIDIVNEALELIGKAHEDGKYIRGTIIAEKKKWDGSDSGGNRVGYMVTINGVEAFLPVRLSYFPHWIEIAHLIGTNIIASVEEINIEKMTITLSMKSPYENLVFNQPVPEKNERTKGIVTRVTPYNVCVLLPQNVVGIIPRYMYPQTQYSDFIKLTGCLINCIPFRVKEWDEKNNNRKMLVSFLPEGENNGNR